MLFENQQIQQDEQQTQPTGAPDHTTEQKEQSLISSILNLIQNDENLQKFFSIEDKYYYIDKIEELQLKIDSLARAHLKLKNTNLFTYYSQLSQLIKDFLKVSHLLPSDSIKNFYTLILTLSVSPSSTKKGGKKLK